MTPSRPTHPPAKLRSHWPLCSLEGALAQEGTRTFRLQALLAPASRRKRATWNWRGGARWPGNTGGGCVPARTLPGSGAGGRAAAGGRSWQPSE